jgi:hypothetical protein
LYYELKKKNPPLWRVFFLLSSCGLNPEADELCLNFADTNKGFLQSRRLCEQATSRGSQSKFKKYCFYDSKREQKGEQAKCLGGGYFVRPWLFAENFT